MLVIVNLTFLPHESAQILVVGHLIILLCQWQKGHIECLMKNVVYLKLSLLNGFVYLIEQRILDTNAEKQLSSAATDAYLTLVLKKWTVFNHS